MGLLKTLGFGGSPEAVAPMLAPTLGFGGSPAYEAASRHSPEMGTWEAGRKSPDAELLPERDRINARSRDMLRNNGLTAGYAQTRLDSVIGAGLTLVPRPNWRALGQTAEWADEWQRAVKSMWSEFADDVDCWIDWTRRANFAGLLSQLYRSYIFNSEMIAVMEWRKGRIPAKSRTAVNVIHPDLLCNPNNEPDRWDLRAGVQLDPVSLAPIGYWFKQSHCSDEGWMGAPAQQWKYVPKYTAWGRLQVIHIYDVEQPGQTRGTPTFAAALLRLRMLDRFEKTALEAQILQAMYAATITSPASASEIAKAMGGPLGSSAECALDSYVEKQAAFHDTGSIRLGGQKVPHLLPGEELKLQTPGNSAPTLEAFEHATLLHLSRALPGVSYEDLSGDYSRTSYSSARASGLTPFRFITGERAHVAHPAATAVYGAWLEEKMDAGLVETPAGAPSFYEAKTAWTRAKWIGAPRGHIDEEKEQKARKMQREMGVLTHEDHCAEQGQDADDVLDRLAMEKVKFKAADLEDMLPNADIAAQKAAADAAAEAADTRDEQPPKREPR